MQPTAKLRVMLVKMEKARAIMVQAIGDLQIQPVVTLVPLKRAKSAMSRFVGGDFHLISIYADSRLDRARQDLGTVLPCRVTAMAPIKT